MQVARVEPECGHEIWHFRCVGCGQETSVSLEPLASGTGFTLISEPAGAQALLDGRALEGATPLKVQSVMAGKHKIEVKTASGSWQQEVTIEAGKMLDPPDKLYGEAIGSFYQHQEITLSKHFKARQARPERQLTLALLEPGAWDQYMASRST